MIVAPASAGCTESRLRTASNKKARPAMVGLFYREEIRYSLNTMAVILTKKFFNRPTVLIAKGLLGKFLVRRYQSSTVARMIADVEAYDGFNDRASHASRGKTQRNFPMFGEPGRWYVYCTYGMHWMLNIVTREKGYPAAVLIRGIEGIHGPARLTKFLKIDKNLNNLPAGRKSRLWIEDRKVKIPPQKIKKGPRIGIRYAGPYWAKRHWRFFIDYSL